VLLLLLLALALALLLLLLALLLLLLLLLLIPLRRLRTCRVAWLGCRGSGMSWGMPCWRRGTRPQQPRQQAMHA
jgi:hypothetical protein